MPKVRAYQGDGITVTYDPRRCIHAAVCVMSLPNVFDPKRKPWVELDHATADQVERVVRKCPTGALQYERDGHPTEAASPNSLEVRPNGPLFVRGKVVLQTVDGEEIVRCSRVALCRCGASDNKPFCDGSHATEGFHAAGDASKLQAPQEDCDELVVTVAENGPLLVRGDYYRCDADAKSALKESKGAWCRCGASENKPFCDGSHKMVGFAAGSSPDNE